MALGLSINFLVAGAPCMIPYKHAPPSCISLSQAFNFRSVSVLVPLSACAGRSFVNATVCFELRSERELWRSAMGVVRAGPAGT